MTTSWLESLKAHAEHHPLVVLRFEGDEWDSLTNGRRGVSEFTFAKPHSLLDGVRVPAPCLLFGKSQAGERVCFGLLSTKSPITTLDTRAKVMRAVDLQPASEDRVRALITETPFARLLTERLDSARAVTLLSPKLSSHVIDRLASLDANKGAVRAVAESLDGPKRYRGVAAMQEDAVRTALVAFGLAANEPATSLELVEGKATALARVSIMEDSVIEHDARSVPGYDLISSDVTGRAVFERGEEQLEVFTANRRELEHCLGVDLIYVNRTKQNLVMLQYKMLEPSGSDNDPDWTYRPDGQLDAEIARMKAFAVSHSPAANEYRLNPQVFYFKFVKRDAALADGGIITPLDHFELIRGAASFRGPRKGLRLSYRALNGHYLRQTPFLDLIKCGYIGSHAATTTHLRVLIDAIVDDNKGVVAAIQRSRHSA